MKKLLATITLVCYLLVTSGIVVNFHYCMHRLASVSLFESESKICARCGMKTDRTTGCCRDEVIMIKMQDDQNKNQVTAVEIPGIKELLSIPSDFIATSIYVGGEQRHFHNHSPPLLSEQDIYLRNGVFRI